MDKQQQASGEMGCKAAMLDGLALGEAIQFSETKNNMAKGVEVRYFPQFVTWLPAVAYAK